MHKAKRSGRNRYQVYGSGDESMALAAIPRETMARDRSAVLASSSERSPDSRSRGND